MTWAKRSGTDAGYLNLDAASVLRPVLVGGVYLIQTEASGTYLAGSYATAADADEAIRELIHGVDLSGDDS